MVTSSKNQKVETISPVFDLVHMLAALGVVAIAMAALVKVAALGVVGASGAAPVPFSGQEQSE